ncbi:MAG: lysine--tRNA ligase, partial [Candidatus Pacebacteria bacterium]|nr:lysine--tRNA ligase [Candidatus Paceibacterota bacterium]
MSTINEIRKNRIKKLEQIKKQGINPYPAKTKRTYTISQALLDFNKLEKAKKNIILAGRIRLIR